MKEWIRYPNRDAFPRQEFPHLTDHFLVLSDQLIKKKPNKTIKKIIGIYPIRRSRREKYLKERTPQALHFPIFCTNRTAYAAIKEIAPIFTKFYMKSSIFPLISPYPNLFYCKSGLLPKNVIEMFNERGAILYDIET